MIEYIIKLAHINIIASALFNKKLFYSFITTISFSMHIAADIEHTKGRNSQKAI
jgi:hypothetical protein